MATARSAQAHQKRVQQIAAEAAEMIAANSPFEEEVVVVVEELPPGEPTRSQSGRSARSEHDAADAALGMVAHTQKLTADGIARWIDLTTAALRAPAASMEPFGALFDPRRLTQETFRLAEELLASQKRFALRVAEAMTSAKAA